MSKMTCCWPKIGLKNCLARATESGYKEVLEMLWHQGRKVQVNLKDDLLLAKGVDCLTAWDLASKKGKMERI